MVVLFLIITGLLTLAYAILIGVYRFWLVRLKQFAPDVAIRPATQFSVIIPARNEALSILSCLRSIQAQSYPAALFEVIVVNDHSTDETEKLVTNFQQNWPQLKLMNLSDHLIDTNTAYKKKAIEIAVAQSTGNWIITTDADCVVPKKWLSLFDNFIQQKHVVFVAAPVMFTNNKSWLNLFQVLDFISLQGITAAAVSAGYHSMCNGANLAYSKHAFEAVGKFKGIDHIASGDDMLLMHKINKRFPGQLGFLYSQDMIVETSPMHTWSQFLHQRIRWASKAETYTDKNIYWVLLLVYCLNAALLTGLLFGIIISGIYPGIFAFLLVKIIVEILFMYPAASFFQLKETLLFFPFMQPFHILYTVIAGWLGKFGTYQWKGRVLK